MSSLDAYRWLVGDEAAQWLLKVSDDLAGRPPLPATVKSLRLQLGSERTALVLEQVALRTKARAKFSQAENLFFTPRGLEQATDELLAGYKAQRFADFAGVADLCCGIGGDAISLAQDHMVDLVDRDEVSLLLAAANVERCGGLLGERIAESVEARHVTETSAWHIDPDRRPAGRRTSRIEFGNPSVATIDTLLAVCGHAAVKLAPAAKVPPHWQGNCQLEWIETRGECRQQVAWFGSLTQEAGFRTATLVDAAGEACSFSAAGEVPCGLAERVGTHLFDPSPSLSAAGLVSALADACGLAALSSGASYLTGDEPVVHPHLQAFAVEQELPLDQRQLRSHLRAKRIGRLEIKKRGVDITPESLRAQLDLAGEESATLILARMGSQARALICRRLQSELP